MCLNELLDEGDMDGQTAGKQIMHLAEELLGSRPERYVSRGQPQIAQFLLMLRCYGEAARLRHHRRDQQRWSFPMTDPFDVRKSDRPFDQDHTLVAVI